MLKELNKYKPSYDEIPDCNIQRIAHARHIIYIANFELYLLAKEATEQHLELLGTIVDIEPQSGMEQISTASKISKVKNITFSDVNEDYVLSSNSVMDATRMHQDDTDVSLDNFLSRPVKIATFQWSTSTVLATTLNPWEAFIENPRVMNRLNNYHMFRGKLHVKIVINGTPFHYGRVMVAYQPLPAFDDLSTHAALIPQDLIQTSQLPHVFLDPTTSLGGHMELPFFWHKNYCNLNTGEYVDLGFLLFRTLTPLKHANGGTDPVTVSVFAWMEDAAVAVPTIHNMISLVPQSGNEADQANTSGFISGPATAISNAAGALSSIGAIKPYALATQQVANLTASVARNLGFSSPVMTKAPDFIVPRPQGQMAVTTVPSTAAKLTVDDKQEVTIDPRVSGLSDEDSLNIKSIASRESYYKSFTWEVGAGPESSIFEMRVTPAVWDVSGIAPNIAVHLPACAVAALPFTYWTGSMRYRFQVVVSSFHKGRLRITYEPHTLSGDANDEYNVNYGRVIDLSEENDFTIEIGPSMDTTYMRHLSPPTAPFGNLWDTLPLPTSTVDNGIFRLSVVNPLTVPNSTINNDVQINVFVSAGDDFQVASPDNTFLSGLMPFPTLVARDIDPSIQPDGVDEERSVEPQSGVENPLDQDTVEMSAPNQYQVDNIGVGEQHLDNLNKVFMGESVTSFRSLLKRYETHEVFRLEAGSITYGRPSHPMPKGFVTGGVHETAASAKYNYVNFTLFNFIRYAFSGYRGSMRWKIVPSGYTVGVDTYLVLHATRTPASTSQTNVYKTVLPIAAGSFSEIAARNVLTSNRADGRFPGNYMLGGAISDMRYANPVLDFEVPYYSEERFVPGKPAQSLMTDGSRVLGFRIHAETNMTSTVSHLLNMVAMGDDGQMLFWTGMPRLYTFTTQPTPNVLV